LAVNRVAVLGFGLILPDNDDAAAIAVGSTDPVDSPKALAQGVQAGTFGYNCIEIQIGTHFQRLSGNDEYRVG
jgi:hypothetical protein